MIPTQGQRGEMLTEAFRSVRIQTRTANDIVILPGESPLYERLNREIDRIDCDAFVVLCDDDKLEPTYLEKTVGRMQETGADIVYTDLRHFGTKDAVWIAPPPGSPPDPNPLPVTALCTKAMWRLVGGYTDGPYFDWQFWWKCLNHGAVTAKVNEPLFLYRNHPGQAGQEDVRLCEEIVRRRYRR
jgi:hypothetical protein